MRRFVPVVCACVATLLQAVHAQAPVPSPRTTIVSTPATLPVRRVILYKNGVGYFVHVGHVTGTQSIAIDFNSAQLNDVLKSLTTLDLGDGRIGNVSFNSEAPLAQRLGALALPVGERTTLMELLGALRGARLEIRTGQTLTTGRLLSVERRPRGKEGDRPLDELTLVTDGGAFRTVELTPAVSVRLAERDSSEQVGRYLELLASNRTQDRRRMTIAAVGTGPRDVMVSYVSEVPIWKTTYRIVLPANGGTPFIQGWAIVDNTIGEDWNNVELSLVAGAPQSFVQTLSKPQYAQRPTAGTTSANMPPPQVHQSTLTGGSGLRGRVIDSTGGPLPGVTVMAIDPAGGRVLQTTDGLGRYAFSGLANVRYRVEFALDGFQSYVLDSVVLDGTIRLAQDAVLKVGGLAESVTVTGRRPRINLSSGVSTTSGLSMFAPAPDAATIEDRLTGMQASAEGQDLGDLFEYRIAGPTTIRKNQSALVPILRTEVGIERVSVWNERTGSTRPLRCLWLTNTSGLTLDGGSFTVLEESAFAGEGLVEPLKPREKRLLSYAVDLGVQIESRLGDEHQQVSRVHFERGAAVEQSERRSRKVYTIRNSDAASRTVVIEHPVHAGWTLVKGAEPVETSLTAYRFAVPVAAGGVATLTVDERRPSETRYAVSQLTDQQVALFVSGARDNPALTQAMTAIQGKKAAIARLSDEVTVRQDEASRIADDQERLRDNMGALKGTAGEQQLLRRYVTQLSQQEDRIEVLRRETADLEQRRERAQGELTLLIEALSMDVEMRAAGQN